MRDREELEAVLLDYIERYDLTQMAREMYCREQMDKNQRHKHAEKPSVYQRFRS